MVNEIEKVKSRNRKKTAKDLEHTLSCATDFSNSRITIKKAFEWGKRIPINIFYKENRPVYLDGLPHLAGKSLVPQKIEPNVKRDNRGTEIKNYSQVL